MRGLQTAGGKVAPPCWICGDDGTTGEHKAKRSDLRAQFGTPTQSKPIYFRDGKGRKRRVGGLDARILKFETPICANCNNARTQPYDRAWQRMSEWFLNRKPAIKPGEVLRSNRIFPYDTAQQMLNVHLFFVKLLGCCIAEEGVPIDLGTLGKALLEGRAHPNVYLRFCCSDTYCGKMVGGTDIDAVLRNSDGSCSFATWFYEVGSLAINIMFASKGEKRQGLVGAWHPRLGTNKLLIAAYE